MKVKEYLDNFNELIKERPEILEYDLVYSSDDEGNNYNKIFYTPGIGYYDKDDNQYYDEDGEYFIEEEYVANSVCIN